MGQDLWAIGIIASLLSGTFVIAITRLLFVWRERKDYLRRVESANNEIGDSVRPLIGKVPLSIELVNSIVMATAQKYGVERRHLHDVETLADDFIKDIMVTPLLSGDQKVEYASCVAKLRTKQRDPESSLSTRTNTLWKYDIDFVSTTLGITSASFAVATVAFLASDGRSSLMDGYWMILAATLVPLVTSLFGYRFWRKRSPGDPKEGLRAIYFVDFKNRTDRQDSDGNGVKKPAAGGEKGQTLPIKYKAK